MRSAVLLPLLAALVVPGTLALDAAGWKRQSVYQLLTDRFSRSDGLSPNCDPLARQYCGGTWRGIIDQLDYIQGMGFTAVWISPVVDNIEGGYHGYWGRDLNVLNDHFGTPEDLLALSNALHARSMYLMLDIFINHLAIPSSQLPLYLPASPSSPPTPLHLPAQYSPRRLHPHCWISDYSNVTQSELCWLGEGADVVLADLDTEDPVVVEELLRGVSELVGRFGVDGIRADTVKHVRKSFWKDFEDAAGVFVTGEVLHGDPKITGPYQSPTILSSVLNYPTHFPLTRAFSSPRGNLFELRDMMVKVQREHRDVTVLGTFLDNHDQKRFAHSVQDPSLRKNALLFPFIADGFPILYSGGEQSLTGGEDPFNREAMWLYGWERGGMWGFVGRGNRARALAITADQGFLESRARPLHTSEHDLVILRGPLLTFLTNRGAGQRGGAVVTVTVPGWKRGEVLVDLMQDDAGVRNQVVVGKGGVVRVILRDGLPQVYLPLKAVKHALEGQGQSAKDLAIALNQPASTRPGHKKQNSFGRGLAWLMGGLTGGALIAKGAPGSRKDEKRRKDDEDDVVY